MVYGLTSFLHSKTCSLITFLVSHWYNNDTLTASPSQVNFLIFVPLFSIISVAYLEIAPRFMPKGNTQCPPHRHPIKSSTILITNPPSIKPLHPSRSRAHERPLLLCRLHRSRRLPGQTSLLPWIRLRRCPRRRHLRSIQLAPLDRLISSPRPRDIPRGT